MKEAFHVAHKKQFGRSFRQVAIEIVNIRVIGTGKIEDLEPIKIEREMATSMELLSMKE